MLLGGNTKGFKGLVSNSRIGDLQHWPLNTTVEVKAVDNGHSPLIFKDQLDRHLQTIRNPGDAAETPANYIYAICGYKSRQRSGKKMICPLGSLTPNERTLEQYLAKRVSVIYLVDIEILDAIRKLRGCTIPRNKIPDPRSVVNVNRTYLNELASNPLDFFQMLGLENAAASYLHQDETELSRLVLKKRFLGVDLNGGAGIDIVFIVPLELRYAILDFISGKNLGKHLHAELNPWESAAAGMP